MQRGKMYSVLPETVTTAQPDPCNQQKPVSLTAGSWASKKAVSRVEVFSGDHLPCPAGGSPRPVSSCSHPSPLCSPCPSDLLCGRQSLESAHGTSFYLNHALEFSLCFVFEIGSCWVSQIGRELTMLSRLDLNS